MRLLQVPSHRRTQIRNSTARNKNTLKPVRITQNPVYTGGIPAVIIIL